MNKKKIVFSSILTLIMCISFIVGGTFALFTSESKNNIVISSGKVEVVAKIGDVETFSIGEAQSNGQFKNGGSANYDKETNTFTVEKMTPGDSVKFNVNVENKSDVAVAYKVNVTFFGELRSALVANVTLPGAAASTKLSAVDVASDWNNFDSTNVAKFPMSIELPIEKGNEFQGKSAEIIVTVEAIQANAANLVMIKETKYDTLAEATAAAVDGDVISLSGTFALPADGSLNGKTVTFQGIKDSKSVIDVREKSIALHGSNLTFDNLTVKFGASNHVGIQHNASITYKNCTLTGKQFLYAPVAKFEKCEFINYNDYCVWTYGASDATFKDCNFTTGGKAILVYIEQAHKATINTTNCNFNSDGSLAKDKAAIEVGESAYGNKSTYTLNINNCVANGFAANKSNSPLWGNKNSMDKDHLFVNIDGAAQENIGNLISINTAEELIAFADDVNAGNEYNGKTIMLTSDIDLENKLFTPIASLNGAKFDGVFDGNGKTISNLNVANASYAGLFGRGWTASVVKNLNLVNVTLKTNHYAGAFVAWTYGDVIDCTVNGLNIDCQPDFNGSKYDNGDKAGAIAGWVSCGEVTGNTVKNATIKAYRDIGGVVGCNNKDNTYTVVDNNTIENVTLIQDSTFDCGEPEDKLFVGTFTGRNDQKEANNKGTATIQKVNYIYTADDMFAFANNVNVNDKDYAGRTVILANNIDLNNKLFTPIGQTGYTEFVGTFNGNDKIISNLNIDTTNDDDQKANGQLATGLFGWNSGAIKNLTIDGATVKGLRRVGALVGYQQFGNIENCTVNDVHVESQHVGAGNDNETCGDKAGAMVGFKNMNVTLTNCKATNSTVKAGRDVGQLVGTVAGANGDTAAAKATLVTCSATNVIVSAINVGECKGGNVTNDLIGRIA